MYETYLQNEREFIEKGADLEHDRWAKWQKYFFSKCLIKPQHEVGGQDDRFVYFALPKDLYERWNRQIDTPYIDLSEQEKESDREQVRPYLPLNRLSRIKEMKALEKELEKEKIITGYDVMKAPCRDEDISGFNQGIDFAIDKVNNFIKYLEQR